MNSHTHTIIKLTAIYLFRSDFYISNFTCYCSFIMLLRFCSHTYSGVHGPNKTSYLKEKAD